MHSKTDSDVTSLAESSPPRSPKRDSYFVQSPSRDSHDGDKSSAMHVAQVYNSPMESPSRSSFGRHSRTSSASRFSGAFARKEGEKLINDKGWPQSNVIEEEGAYGDDDLRGKGISKRCQVAMALVISVMFFAVLCLIIWGASRSYNPKIVMKSLTVDNFYAGEGSDSTGVPTKMVSSNLSLTMSIYNPASTFGIHVTSAPINLMYSQIAIATGQLKYYQPKKSHHTSTVVLQGEKVPLYGAGAGLVLSSTSGAIPLTLDMVVVTRAYVVGKLVKVTHERHVSCAIKVSSAMYKPIKFSQDSCTYA